MRARAVRGHGPALATRYAHAATLLVVACLLWVATTTQAFAALDPALLTQLGTDDPDVRVAAVRKIGASGEPRAAAVLEAIANDALAIVNGRAVIVSGSNIADAATGDSLGAAPAGLETIVVNNRLRGELDGALAGLKLSSPNRQTRLAAAKELQASDNDDLLPILQAALAKESDPDVKTILQLAAASLGLKSSDVEVRLQAAKALRRATIRRCGRSSRPCSPSRRTAAIPRPTSGCATLRRGRSTRSVVACAPSNSA
jgi:urea transport system permease protein